MSETVFPREPFTTAASIGWSIDWTGHEADLVPGSRAFRLHEAKLRHEIDPREALSTNPGDTTARPDTIGGISLAIDSPKVWSVNEGRD